MEMIRLSLKVWRNRCALFICALGLFIATHHPGQLLAASEEKPGMPQLDMTTYGTQLFWLVVTFVILLILLWSFALPRIGRVLDQRQRQITDDLEQAEKLKQESEDAIKAYEASLSEARSKAHQLLTETQSELDEQAAQQRNMLDTQLEEKQTQAETQIREAREQALDSVREVAIEAARAATHRLIGVEPTRDAANSAINGKT